MDKKFKIISTQSVASISVTGNFCELSCKHCNKKYLKSMIDIKDKEFLNYFKDKNTALISGGSLKNGSVPFYNHLDLIKKIKENNILLNGHTGYIPEDKFDQTFIFNSLSIDICGSDKILKEIYNLNLSLKEYQENILKLNEFLINSQKNVYFDKIEYFNKPAIVPHITIGIYYGKYSFEEEAIDFLKKIKPGKLVLNVLIPTKNTAFEKISEIDIKRVLQVFNYAKNQLPDSLIYLGCMRPFGLFREELDFLLFEKKIDGIVNPSKKFMKFLESKITDNYIQLKGCCSLL
ncbi:MAG: hypothetical protein ACK4YF_08505 [Exilispira sp.]